MYRVYTDTDHNQIGTKSRAFGIVFEEAGKPAQAIPDISDDRDRIEALARLFNEEGLDPVHFEQAVEDYLCDFMLG